MTLQYSRVSKLSILIAAGVGIAVFIAFSLFVIQRTSAANTYMPLSFTDPWTIVRGTPSGGYTANSNRLQMLVDNEIADPGVSNQTEIVSQTIPESDYISGTLAIDDAWQSQPVRVGLWGEVYSSLDSTVTQGWPIIEFTTIGENDFTGFRVYDTRGGVSQKWYNLEDVSFEWGEDAVLGIGYSRPDQSYVFYVNDQEVLRLPASRSDNDDSPRDVFRSIMFADFNSLTGNSADNYYATWWAAGYGKLPVRTGEVANAGNAHKVQVVTPAGTTLTSTEALKEDVNSADTAYDYPLGLMNFSFDTDTEDNIVTLTFVTDLTPDQVLARKFNPTTKEYATISGATITETTFDSKHALLVKYNIVDNGDLDLDPAVGKVSDPVGLAVVPGVPNTGFTTLQPAVLVTVGGVAGAVLLAGGIAVFRHALRYPHS